MSLKCPAVGCTSSRPPDRLFCPAHWAKVPEHLQHELARLYTREATDESLGGQPGDEFTIAAVRAIGAVGVMEGVLSKEDAERRERDTVRVIEMRKRLATQGETGTT